MELVHSDNRMEQVPLALLEIGRSDLYKRLHSRGKGLSLDLLPLLAVSKYYLCIHYSDASCEKSGG